MKIFQYLSSLLEIKDELISCLADLNIFYMKITNRNIPRCIVLLLSTKECNVIWQNEQKLQFSNGIRFLTTLNHRYFSTSQILANIYIIRKNNESVIQIIIKERNIFLFPAKRVIYCIPTSKYHLQSIPVTKFFRCSFCASFGQIIRNQPLKRHPKVGYSFPIY